MIVETDYKNSQTSQIEQVQMTLRCPRSFNRRTAFSLIDVMMAMLVLAVGIIPCVTLLGGSQLLDQQAQYQQSAANAAEWEMEKLRSQSFGSLSNMGTSGTFTVPSAITSQYTNSGGTNRVTFTGAYQISSLAGVGDSTHAAVNAVVIVTWTRPDLPSTGKTSSVRLNTIITQGATK